MIRRTPFSLRARKSARRRERGGDRGSVLMEYVVLCSFVGIAVAVAVYTNFYNVSEGYVGTGLKFVQWRQILLHALSLPIP